MKSPLERFQSLLRELFQFDCQDLDFGIYRVLNFKRREIEDFITTRLPQRVDAAFARYAEADQAAAERELELKRQQILATLGPDAFDATGQLTMAFRETPLGRQFAELQQQTRASRVADELKESVFNDLYAFFSRYYDEGDIFSKPRRGKVEIPFTGHEDVVLHWANKDQYYIKTGEQFKSYRFKLPDQNAAVAFALRNVSAEQNNNRAEKRYFVLAAEKPVEWTEDGRELTVYFEYRPLTAAEKETYGKTENQKPQDKLNAEAEPAILRRIKDPAIKARLAQPMGEGKPSLLLHHLTRFTRKNTTDFFIHKDLRGFLTRELDDFLKTEVLKTDELLAGDPEVPRRALLRARVVREIGMDLIDWLAQIEDFQKKLFEKRKFVVRTEYCVTLDRLPEALWDDVLANKAQIEEWRQLYALDDLLKAAKKKKPDRAFLKAHDKLVVDTRHFPETFKWRLLEALNDLDAALDGLCIKSENFQALALLLPKYRERVSFVHIDPPYNTETSGFLYKNNYQHSSWLAMMENRIPLSFSLLTDPGVFACHVDENEIERLGLLMDNFPLASAGTLVWDKGMPVAGAEGLAIQHEYVVFATRGGAEIRIRKKHVQTISKKVSELLAKYGRPSKQAIAEYRRWLKSQTDFSAAEKTYDLFDELGGAFRSDNMSATDRRTDPKFFIPLKHPVTCKDCPVPEYGWRYAPETMRELLDQKLILFGEDHTSMPRKKRYLKSTMDSQMPSVFRSGSRGKTDLDNLGFEFPFSHSADFYEYIIGAASQNKALVLDFFAGSGTSGHAVINLNREDGGARKYILVESEAYFDTVLLPRLKKVVFCAEWKDGKPAGGAGVSHLMKYQVLEQYEDALNNLELPRAREGELALRQFGDEYLLKYMLEFETAGSPSLLNIERLTHPFAYRLKVQEGDEIVERTVDLIETFNYLLGLHVKKLREFRDGERLYRAVLGEDRRGKSVVVVWRDTAGLENNPSALQADRQFIEQTILPALLGEEARPDRLLVNQPCTAAEAEAIEPEFKRLMFEPLR